MANSCCATEEVATSSSYDYDDIFSEVYVREPDYGGGGQVDCVWWVNIVLC